MVPATVVLDRVDRVGDAVDDAPVVVPVVVLTESARDLRCVEGGVDVVGQRQHPKAALARAQHDMPRCCCAGARLRGGTLGKREGGRADDHAGRDENGMRDWQFKNDPSAVAAIDDFGAVDQLRRRGQLTSRPDLRVPGDHDHEPERGRFTMAEGPRGRSGVPVADVRQITGAGFTDQSLAAINYAAGPSENRTGSGRRSQELG